MRFSNHQKIKYPNAKTFAFTILDDTDVATTEKIKPIYRLLEELGMHTTKTVWPMSCPEGSKNFSNSDTLENEEYKAFIADLQKRGFEIALHGATMESSKRERTLAGLQRFKKVFTTTPSVYANHALNRENLYWGSQRFDNALLKFLYRKLTYSPDTYYQGNIPTSPYWWGDLCKANIKYVRNLTFNELNMLRINPSMPYKDPKRPYVDCWFSTSDAEDCKIFNHLLRSGNQEKLERESGICIISTHFGKEFTTNGQINPLTRKLLEELAMRNGWFPTVGELLNWLKSQHNDNNLPAFEWYRMQFQWAFDMLKRKWIRRKLRKT